MFTGQVVQDKQLVSDAFKKAYPASAPRARQSYSSASQSRLAQQMTGLDKEPDSWDFQHTTIGGHKFAKTLFDDLQVMVWFC
jgi:hypothetical protein